MVKKTKYGATQIRRVWRRCIIWGRLSHPCNHVHVQTRLGANLCGQRQALRRYLLAKRYLRRSLFVDPCHACAARGRLVKETDRGVKNKGCDIPHLPSLRRLTRYDDILV